MQLKIYKRKGVIMKNVFNFDLVEDFMEKNALTKKQFCLKCNVSQATFSKMEEGDWDIKIGDIFKLIDFINVPLKNFINQPEEWIVDEDMEFNLQAAQDIVNNLFKIDNERKKN